MQRKILMEIETFRQINRNGKKYSDRKKVNGGEWKGHNMDRQIDNWRQTNRYRENNNSTSNKTMKKVRGGGTERKKTAPWENWMRGSGDKITQFIHADDWHSPRSLWTGDRSGGGKLRSLGGQLAATDASGQNNRNEGPAYYCQCFLPPCTSSGGLWRA